MSNKLGIHIFVDQSIDHLLYRSSAFFRGWTAFTIIPIASNASGGMLVGLVTKRVGAVQKVSVGCLVCVFGVRVFVYDAWDMERELLKDIYTCKRDGLRLLFA